MQEFWSKKASYMQNPHQYDEGKLYFERAGIYAEFGKVVAIGLGFFHWDDDNQLCFKVKTLTADSETELLSHSHHSLNPNIKVIVSCFVHTTARSLITHIYVDECW
jgi:hypothetical protein